MVVWSPFDVRPRLARTGVLAQFLDRQSPTTLADPRAWGFTHGVRRPRPAFDTPAVQAIG